MAINIQEITEQLNQVENSLSDGVSPEDIALMKRFIKLINSAIALGERYRRAGMDVDSDLEALRSAKNTVTKFLSEFDR